MKNIKVSFLHPAYIFQFKIELCIYENTNMLSIDPRKVMSMFAEITSILILTAEEKNALDSLSIGTPNIIQLSKRSSSASTPRHCKAEKKSTILVRIVLNISLISKTVYALKLNTCTNANSYTSY